MTQSRMMSMVETLTNIVVGLALAMVTQHFIYEHYGVELPAGENLTIALVFTAISVVRSYTLRRCFNALLHKGK